MGVQEVQELKCRDCCSHILELKYRDCCSRTGCALLESRSSNSLMMKAQTNPHEYYERAVCASFARMLFLCGCLIATATLLAGWLLPSQISRLHQSQHMVFFALVRVSSILSLASLLGAVVICAHSSSMQLAGLRRALLLSSIILAVSLALVAGAFSTRVAEDIA